jgi:hypothetical protein
MFVTKCSILEKNLSEENGYVHNVHTDLEQEEEEVVGVDRHLQQVLEEGEEQLVLWMGAGREAWPEEGH